MTKSTRSLNLLNLLTAVFFSLLVMGILLNPLFAAPGRDSGIFLYIGSLILKGKLPYLAAWENKGPLIFYINALGLLISNGSRWGVWLMEFLFLLGAVYLGYRTTQKTMGDLPALVGAFLWVMAVGRVLEGGNLSEEYSLLFYFLAAWAFLKSLTEPTRKLHIFLIGVSLGLSILLRPNNIGIHIAIAGTYFVITWFSKDWKLLLNRAVFIALGALAVILPMVLWFALRGGLGEMVRVVLVFNYQYSGESDPASILNGIQIAFKTIRLPYSLLAFIGYLAALLSLFRKETFDSPLGKFLLLLVIGWPLEILLSTLSGRNYLHYFITWAPYIGFLSAYAVYAGLNRLTARPNPAFEYALLAGLTLIVIFGRVNIWQNYASVLATRFSQPHPDLEYHLPVAEYIEANTQPTDTVLIWGFRPAVYFMSGREAPAAFLPYPLIHVDTPLGYHWADQFYEQLLASPPALIIDMTNPTTDPIPVIDEEIRKTQKKVLRGAVLAPNLEQVFEYIHTYYILADEVDGYPVYKRK